MCTQVEIKEQTSQRQMFRRDWTTLSYINNFSTLTTLNMTFSVWSYSMLLPPYLAQHQFSIPWQLVLDINVPIPSLLPPTFLWSMDFIGLVISGMAPHLLTHRFLICRSRWHSFQILTITKIKHVTSTYYHSWYLMFEFIINVTYFHGVIDI